jgi:hypothetical protein
VIPPEGVAMLKALGMTVIAMLLIVLIFSVAPYL